MQRFKKILVYVPDHGLRNANAAVQHAAALAKNHGADLKLLCVHDSFWMREHDQALEDLAAPLRERGLRVTTEHPWGVASEEIIREVLRNNHDLVMKTASPEDGKRMSFGTTGLRLMRVCPCPVLIVQPSQTKPFERVLATVDLRAADDINNALNVKILELGTSLAQLQHAELHVLHAWSVYHEKLLKSQVAANEVRGYVQATATDARARLADLLSPFADSVPGDHVHLLEGAAAEVIPRFTRDRQIDIIVMGTVARTGMAGFVIGNTAERILQQVACSVLTLKPDEFESPGR